MKVFVATRPVDFRKGNGTRPQSQNKCRMKKVYPSAEAALEGVLFDGMTIASGGFGLCGIPEFLIAAIRKAGTTDLKATLVS